jgi:hypothetical protein
MVLQWVPLFSCHYWYFLTRNKRCILSTVTCRGGSSCPSQSQVLRAQDKPAPKQVMSEWIYEWVQITCPHGCQFSERWGKLWQKIKKKKRENLPQVSHLTVRGIEWRTLTCSVLFSEAQGPWGSRRSISLKSDKSLTFKTAVMCTASKEDTSQMLWR